MNSEEGLDGRLSCGLAAMDVSVLPEQRAALIQFLVLLNKWGHAFNLTAIKEMPAAVDLHLLDSLAVSAHLTGRTVLDVGTGAGLPGIPLAIMNPEMRFVLMDRSAKKIRFVRQAVMELRLKNVEAIVSRIEDYQTPNGFDVVIARAFASLAEIHRLTARLLAPGGRILAMKGRLPVDEMKSLGQADARIHAIVIPGIEVERHLIELRVD